MAKKENFVQRFRRFADETGKYVTGNSEVNPLDRGPRTAPSPSLKPDVNHLRKPFPGESQAEFQRRLERVRKRRQAQQQ